MNGTARKHSLSNRQVSDLSKERESKRKKRATHIAIRRVPTKQAPKRIAADSRALLKAIKKGLKVVAAGGPDPIVLASEVDFPGSGDGIDAGLQLRVVDGVEVVRENVDLVDAQVRFVDAVGAVEQELRGGQGLDVARDLAHPGCRAVFIAPHGARQLVACLVGEDGWVRGVREVCVWVRVGQEGCDVVFEGGEDGRVGVELLDFRVRAVAGLGQVVAGPAEEVVFSAVVVILLLLLL